MTSYIKTGKLKKPKSKQNYIDNEAFLESIKKYQTKLREAKELGKELPRIPEFCGLCLLNIAKGLAHHHRFIGYSFKEDLISDGVENALQYFNNFDPDKSNNPFAYYTTIMYYAFFRRIAVEEKNSYVKYKSYYLHVSDTELEEQLREENTGVTFEGGYDNLMEFIDRFEKRKEMEKQERKKKKAEKTAWLKEDDNGEFGEFDPGDDSGLGSQVEFLEPEQQ